MARRKQSSLGAFLVTEVPKDLTHGLVGLIASMPWWGGLVLAVGTYLGLHHLASQPKPPLESLGQFYDGMGALLVWALATVAQYLLPLLCLIGVGLSYRSERQRGALVRQVTANPTADALDAITWQEFEQLVGEFFRMQGYQVEEVGGGGADGGVDLVMRRNGEKFLVQCKQWKANRVSVEIVREMFGLMTAKGAVGGFVVTSGKFTRPAREFAQGRNLALIDGAELSALLEQTYANRKTSRDTNTVPTAMASTPPNKTAPPRASMGAAARAAAAAAPPPPRSEPAFSPPPAPPLPPVSTARAPSRVKTPPPSAPRPAPPQQRTAAAPPRAPAAKAERPAPRPAATGTDPQCPVCARPMLLRTARKGPQAGQLFWGCVDYPICQGTRSR